MGHRFATRPPRPSGRWWRAVVVWPFVFLWRAGIMSWLGPLLNRRTRRELAAELRETLGFLSQERGGRIITNPSAEARYPHSVDIVIAADGLLFYFWRIANPDEYGVRAQVAPAHAPKDSQDLSFALMTSDPTVPVDRRGWVSPSTIAQYLRPGYDLLKLALSPENFEKTKQRIRHIEIHGSSVRT